MILDEHGFAWRCVRVAHGPRGEQCCEYECASEPRLIRMVQRAGPAEDWVETFSVHGLAQVYRTVTEAAKAARLNPA